MRIIRTLYYRNRAPRREAKRGAWRSPVRESLLLRFLWGRGGIVRKYLKIENDRVQIPLRTANPNMYPHERSYNAKKSTFGGVIKDGLVLGVLWGKKGGLLDARRRERGWCLVSAIVYKGWGCCFVIRGVIWVIVENGKWHQNRNNKKKIKRHFWYNRKWSEKKEGQTRHTMPIFQDGVDTMILVLLWNDGTEGRPSTTKRAWQVTSLNF